MPTEYEYEQEINEIEEAQDEMKMNLNISSVNLTRIHLIEIFKYLYILVNKGGNKKCHM